MVDTISRAELLGRLRDPRLRIVDLLPRESFDQIHLRGAVNLPMAELLARAPSLLSDRRADIVVYCGGPT